MIKSVLKTKEMSAKMKKNYQCFLIILLWIVFFAAPLSAKDIYVKGVTNITMRMGGPRLKQKVGKWDGCYQGF